MLETLEFAEKAMRQLRDMAIEQCRPGTDITGLCVYKNALTAERYLREEAGKVRAYKLSTLNGNKVSETVTINVVIDARNGQQLSLLLDGA